MKSSTRKEKMRVVRGAIVESLPKIKTEKGSVIEIAKKEVKRELNTAMKIFFHFDI